MSGHKGLDKWFKQNWVDIGSKKKGGGLMEATSRLRAQGLKMGGIARGCGAVMSDRRKKTKMY